ncbi:MAG: hypothetical protein B0D96_01330 [Candidatus Sedimenticola endophacoides]|nr:MAG: hypothetical protein B0D94_04495 [Candidatus Sedimenticola endophacoides]OQX37758.1 MAG: hypothetical protein B0D96_01330 [Candidatus Sedimenticola endophacoides]OQX38993.1 MAG: hypothetical protein B0D89_11685 [Candidatus Sedimenticola endophacoides]OQX43884.1 MAG: hypothetical protein B0D86_06775 [Candidatus Sedimenticola endophacoides]OQX47758.1 MAG: hypothetical protein B0D87_08745 [Candidatus Sedimenticola endophacoides]
MHEMLEKLQRDHANLKRVLEILSHQIDLFCEGHESNTDLLIELIEYLESYADHGHHPLEDEIFRVGLKERPEQLAILYDQHAGLSRMTRRFRNSLEGVLQGEVMLREEIGIQGREYVALQSQHLDLEEGEVFPYLERQMTPGKWGHVGAHLPRYDDPVFDAPDRVRFHNLLAYLERDTAAVT